tara:strand:- start:1315 stop:2484 length:1170 start_codon:yes stop_codon:yes gene_type:complete
MTDEERRQLQTIVERVTTMVERKYSGWTAEIIKHAAYCFLEVSMSGSQEEWEPDSLPENESLDLSRNDIKAVDQHNRNFKIASILLFIKISTGVDVDFSYQISETLKPEFMNFSDLVKKNLVNRCFVLDFKEASLKSYCLLILAGVLPVTKFRSDGVNGNFDESFVVRLSLMADHKMASHFFQVLMSKANIADTLLDKLNPVLNEKAIDDLIGVRTKLYETRSKKSLRGVPLTNGDLTTEGKAWEFFSHWEKRKSRFRIHSKSLGGWLGILGAEMVEIRRLDELRNVNSVLSDRTSGAEKSAIFRAIDNRGTITDQIRHRLAQYGFSINADTLYRHYSEISKTTIPLIDAYCEALREAKFQVSTTEEEDALMSVFSYGIGVLNSSETSH